MDVTMTTETRAELLLRILCDVLPERADAAYLFAETEPNQESVFDTGRRLIDEGRAGKLLISDCTPKSGYIGAAAYRCAMVKYGIPEASIEEVPMEPTPILHTLVEAQTVVRHARTRGYSRLVVVSVPFHQERAFITVVSETIREYPSLKVYSCPGRPQLWDEMTVHSQGKLRGTRAELIAEERKRIDAYTAKGDLLSRGEILAYFRTRG
jgi:uncharacterized SAM-binding protein YcdF (DUF218 family)